MLDFLWAQTIWIIYMWRCVKRLPSWNIWSCWVGAKCSQPQQKCKETFIFRCVPLHKLLGGRCTETVTIVHLTVQPRVFQGPLREPLKPSSVTGGKKQCFAGLIQSKSKSKKEEIDRNSFRHRRYDIVQNDNNKIGPEDRNSFFFETEHSTSYRSSQGYL